MADDIHDQIVSDREDYDSNGADVKCYREYAKGRHQYRLTDRQQEILVNLLSTHFCDNICHQIIVEARNRLNFQSWLVKTEPEQVFLTKLYGMLNIGQRHGKIHYDMLMDGNTTIGLGWDNKRKFLRMTREKWWNGSTGIFVGYDDNDEAVYATKDWYVGDGNRILRRTVWFDDRIERYMSEDQGISWDKYQLPEDKSWPVPWLKMDGSPLHMPIIHFPDASKGTDNYGESELSGGVLGFQDQLNELQYAISASARLTAFQIIWGTGMALKPDPDNEGEFISPEIGPATFLNNSNPAGRFGYIPSGDIRQLIETHKMKLTRVAQMTSTPVHRITGGDWPSGEALMRAEEPATAKAEEQIKTVSVRWVVVGHRAMEIFNRFTSEKTSE